MDKIAAPILARYRAITEYTPTHGDLVISAGWFTSQFGLVTGFDATTNQVSIIWEGHPRLLVTMSEEQQLANTVRLPLSDLRSNWFVKYSILKRDEKSNANIWFV